MRTADDDGDFGRELARLGRRHAAVVHQRRIEHLSAWLHRNGSLAVRHSTPGFSGDRTLLHLDDGTVLKLRLYWPRREPIAALCSIRWAASVGWVVQARSTAGDDLTLYAWRAVVEPTHLPPTAGQRVVA